MNGEQSEVEGEEEEEEEDEERVARELVTMAMEAQANQEVHESTLILDWSDNIQPTIIALPPIAMNFLVKFN